MAYLEPRTSAGTPSRNFSVVFSFRGKTWKKSTGSKDRTFAESCLARVRENLRLVSIGRLEGVDVAAFMMSDGRIQGTERTTESLKFGDLFELYKESLPVRPRPSVLTKYSAVTCSANIRCCSARSPKTERQPRSPIATASRACVKDFH